MTTTRDYLAGLTDAQRAAAETRHGNVIVLAAPGSGKTHMLVGRVLTLVRSYGVDASRVLAITFTNAAVDALARRTLNVLGLREGETPPNVSTFHSLGMQILRASWKDKGEKRRMPATEAQSEEIVQGLFKGPNRRADLANKLGITRARDALLNYASGQPLTTEHKIAFKPEHRHMAIEFIKAYRRRHAEAGMIGFDEIPPAALDAAMSPTSSVLGIVSHYAHVLVDEAHDQTECERALTRVFMGHGANRMQVMDPRQRIFTWRGASIDLDDWDREEPQVLNLGRSFRCPQRVCTVANRAAARGFPATEGLSIMTTEKDVGVLRTLDPSWKRRPPRNPWKDGLWVDEEQIAEVIVRTAMRVGPENVCVLARTNRGCDEIAGVIDDVGLPRVGAQTYQQARGSMGRDETEVDVVMAAARLCLSSDDDYAFNQLRDRFPGSAGLKGDGWGSLFDLWASQRSGPLPPLAERVRASQGHTGVLLKDLVPSLYTTKRAHVLQLLEQEGLHELELDEAITKWSLGAATLDPYKAIRDAGKVTVSTVHAARGREWRSVFVLTDPQWPGTPSPQYEGRGAEEWRLLFVALTRAEEELTVVVGNSRVARLLK